MLFRLLSNTILIIVLFVAAFVTLVGRKVIALIQQRRGPNVYEVKGKDLCFKAVLPSLEVTDNSTYVESFNAGFVVGVGVMTVLLITERVGFAVYDGITGKSDAKIGDNDNSDSDEDA